MHLQMLSKLFGGSVKAVRRRVQMATPPNLLGLSLAVISTRIPLSGIPRGANGPRAAKVSLRAYRVCLAHPVRTHFTVRQSHLTAGHLSVAHRWFPLVAT